MPNFSADVVDRYNWLRHKGIYESDMPKFFGGKRQYFHKLRKQNGSSEYELQASMKFESHYIFKGY
jgi:hypothetical protein